MPTISPTPPPVTSEEVVERIYHILRKEGVIEATDDERLTEQLLDVVRGYGRWTSHATAALYREKGLTG